VVLEPPEGVAAMKRIASSLGRVIACIALGAAINVTVCWVLAMTVEVGTRSFGARLIGDHGVGDAYVRVDARGLPFLAMSHRRKDLNVYDGVESTFRPFPGGGPRVLPLRIHWSGFIGNTLIYAALVWAVLLGPATARRAMRRWGARCLSCGYALRDLAVCPECGERRRARRATRASIVYRVIGAVLGGFVITVIVAWTCAVAIDPGWFGAARESGRRVEGDRVLVSECRSRAGALTCVVSRRAAKLPMDAGFGEPTHLVEQVFPRESSLVRRGVLDARGWPMLCLYSERGSRWDLGFAVHGGLPTAFPSWTWPYQSNRVLPVAPIWTGLIVNTFVYAVLVWLVLWVAETVALRHRVRTRLCPRCTAQVNDGGTCPSCGAEVEAEANVRIARARAGLRLLALAVLGGACTLGTAWLCASYSPRREQPVPAEDAAALWTALSWSRPISFPESTDRWFSVEGSTRRGLGTEEHLVRCVNTYANVSPPDRATFTLVRSSAGLPWRAVHGLRWTAVRYQRTVHEKRAGVLAVGDTVPSRIDLIPFVADTAVFMIGIAGLRFAWRRLRTRRAVS
jgi:hypothetical protein